MPHLPCIAHARLARTSVSFRVAGGAALFGVDGAAAAADTAAGAVASVAGAAAAAAGSARAWLGLGLGVGLGRARAGVVGSVGRPHLHHGPELVLDLLELDVLGIKLGLHVGGVRLE